MFEELKARVIEGRFIIVGGWKVQPDCNLPSGENFARMSLYSQRWFKEKFGKLWWLVTTWIALDIMR